MVRPPDHGQSFKAFEHEGWERVAAPYREAFASLTRQSVEPLLDVAGTAPGVRLLDVASGPGDASAAAARRGAQVTGVDFSSAMVEQASRMHPEVTFRAGDAEALPFEDASFDAVVINFGILHFAHPDRAIAEAHRVLRPGGRLAFTAWTSPHTCVAMGIILRAIEAHGRMNVPLPEGPPFFRFGEADECRRTLDAAGFADAAAREIPMRWRLPAADSVLDAFLEGGVRTRGLLVAQSPEALAAIREAVRSESAHYACDGGVEYPMASVLTSGMKARG